MADDEGVDPAVAHAVEEQRGQCVSTAEKEVGESIMSRRTRNRRTGRGRSYSGRRSLGRNSRLDPGQGKMSEVVVNLARPWIDRFGPSPQLPAVEFAYQACGLLWNVSRLTNTPGREDQFQRVLREVTAAAPMGTRTEVRGFVETAYRRAVGMRPQDQRLIVDMTVEDRGNGDFHLLVASARGERQP